MPLHRPPNFSLLHRTEGLSYDVSPNRREDIMHSVVTEVKPSRTYSLRSPEGFERGAVHVHRRLLKHYLYAMKVCYSSFDGGIELSALFSSLEYLFVNPVAHS